MWCFCHSRSRSSDKSDPSHSENKHRPLPATAQTRQLVSSGNKSCNLSSRLQQHPRSPIRHHLGDDDTGARLAKGISGYRSDSPQQVSLHEPSVDACGRLLLESGKEKSDCSLENRERFPLIDSEDLPRPSEFNEKPISFTKTFDFIQKTYQRSTEVEISSKVSVPMPYNRSAINTRPSLPSSTPPSRPPLAPSKLQRAYSNRSVTRRTRFSSLTSHSSQKALVSGSNLSEVGSLATSRRGSLYIFSHSDEPIVTPFAQILASLRKVRSNFMLLTNTNSLKDSHFSPGNTTIPVVIHSPGGSDQSDIHKSGSATETLRELEWCLEQLETIQTHRSVSEMATNKFRKMLSKELSQFNDNGKSGLQVSQYIRSFMGNDNPLTNGDNKSDEDIPEEPEGESEDDGMSAAHVEPMSTGRTAESHTDILAIAQSSHSNNRQSWKLNRAMSMKYESHARRMSSVDIADEQSTIQGNENNSANENVPSEVRERGWLFPMEISNFPNVSELEKLLEENLDDWGIDIFKVAEESNQQPLTVVTFSIFKKRGLMEKFDIDPHVLLKYLYQVETHYHSDIPYHNSIHAADVTQSTHVLLLAEAVDNAFNDLEILAAIFSCAIHDVNHPGLTNQYLINTGDPLAVLYNDVSVLENHHLAVAFSLLKQEGCDIFAHFTKKMRSNVRKMTIDMVLATDMSKHMSLLADLKTMVETKKVSGSGVLNPDVYNEKIQILQSLVHCADLSNPAKPLPLYREWTTRIMEEFFRQGDKERVANLELSPMCDRENASIEKSQVSFIDFIAHPLWETWADLVYPDAQKIFDILQENRDWYCSQVTSSQSHSCACTDSESPPDNLSTSTIQSVAVGKVS